LGGVRGALAKHAEATYAGLSDDDRRLAQSLFLRLIEPGLTEQDATRRRAPRRELTLTDAAESERLRVVAERFVQKRLLLTDSSAGEETIEVSHEALIRVWDRLQNWLHYAREDIVIQRNVSQDSDAWARAGRPAVYDGFYRGSILLEKLAWAGRMTPSADEWAFIQAGQTDAEREAEADRERDARELQLAQEAAANARRAEAAERARATRARRAALLAGIIGALALVAFVAAALVGANTAQQVTKLNNQVTFSALELNRFATLNAVGVNVPVGTQTPGSFEPTLTQIAVLNAHDPTLPQNQMTDSSGVQMVFVPAGCFFMGSDKDDGGQQPSHQVCLKAFWLDKTEVTQGDFVRLGGKKTGANASPGADRPVENIDWFEARDFCQLRGARLPSEAEWEYAARGPDSRVYPWGNTFVAENGVYFFNSYGQTAPVGSRPGGASWVGALDMSGNVWEWVSSQHQSYPYKPDDGRESNIDTNIARGLRGGSWNFDGIVQAAFRFGNLPSNQNPGDGFRCALS
jgi:formylglycine-generating enzyme required for sulfatase activity